MNRAVFLDRDGTLVKTGTYENEKNVAPRRPEDLKLLRDTPGTLKELHQACFFIIITSNQPDIALGKIDEATRKELEKKFKDIIKQNKIHVDEIYYCHHHPNGINPKYPKECNCRKPKPGMLLMAAKKWNISLKDSWVVGDSDKDIDAGKSAGCKTILIKRSYSQGCDPNFTVENLSQIVDIVIQSN